MDNKWIEIARTGTFTDSAGRPQTFTARDLDAIARAYDPAKRDAPLVFGHPQTDAAPAFGWAEKLKCEGGKLFASFAHVPGEVRDLVAKGHYRHVSMSLMPDRVTLRHVALLGAAQPAIDGLRAVEFKDGGDAITVDFAIGDSAARDGGGPRSGSEAATALAARPTERREAFPLGESTSPYGNREQSDSESRTGRAGERHPEKREGDNMTVEELQRQVGQLQAQLEALKSENADLKKERDAHKEDKDKAEAAKTEAEQKAEKAGADFAAYKGKIETERREARVAELVRAGKVRPAEKAGVLSFAATLAKVTEPVDFAAPDGATERISAEDRYFRELDARPVDERFADFSAPPAHAGHTGGRQEQNINPAELTAKL